MWASIGFKKTIKTITQFPALILTPIFSYWVFGPMESKSCSNLCCRENSRLGLSFFHTWINAGLTIVGQIIFSYLFFDILKQSIGYSDAASWRAGWVFGPEFGTSVKPVTTRGADYAHQITASPPRFENPAASL